MDCSQCKTQLAVDAKFCHLCGCPVIAAAPNNALDKINGQIWEPLKSPVSILLIVLLAGLYAAVIFPAFGGVPFDYPHSGTSVLFMSVLVWAALWKRLKRRIWVGALLGFAAYLVATAMAGFAVGLHG